MLIHWLLSVSLVLLAVDYIKLLKAKNQLDSDMTERILKCSISTLEGFNWVRNNKSFASFAHPSNVLNYDESLFIYNHVTALVRFIEAIERREGLRPSTADLDEHIPF